MITIHKQKVIEKKDVFGNIVIDVELEGEIEKIIGFENHGGQTYDVDLPFGSVKYGNGNKFSDDKEGFFSKNVLATYLHGPLLSKNPVLADYIIKYCLERKTDTKIELEKLNDEFEEKCRKQLLERFLEG